MIVIGRRENGAGGRASGAGGCAAEAAAAARGVSVWLMLQAFSSGCTAMTGVEAVSNGVMAFREPTRK